MKSSLTRIHGVCHQARMAYLSHAQVRAAFPFKQRDQLPPLAQRGATSCAGDADGAEREFASTKHPSADACGERGLDR